MKGFGEILLISCYELGHQPLGIAMPLGFLERAGYAPDGMDLSVESFETDRVNRARFVGICVPMHTALRLGVRVATRIRKINPDCHICFFGLCASLNAQYLLDHEADSVISGEYELPLVQLIDTLTTGTSAPVEGVSTLNQISGPFLKHLPFVAPSRRRLPPLERYAHLEENGVRRLVGYVEASRGCRHLCLHCPIPPVYEGRFFLVPQEIVIDDVRRLIREGASHITFGDPDFLNGPNYSLRIVRALHKEFPKLTFDFTAKVEHVLKYRELFPEFSACGCIFMVSAVESLSDTVLTILNKGHTREDVFTALAILREAGIALRPSLVSFTPWTTLDDYISLLEFVGREGLIDHLDPVQYTIRLLVPPGSSLLSHPAMKPHLGPLIQESFTYQWTHPDPRMDQLQRRVSKVVENSTEIGEDTEITFYRVRELAYATRDNRPLIEVNHSPRSERRRPPRLTEPWFCCAEPTEGQFNSL
jgi:radical SAM superfamily enzyme YgiQ (UPF0313 family)